MWEQRASSSPEIRTVWRAFVEKAADYTDEASEHWGLSFIRRPDSSLAAELAGPRVEALPIRSRVGESYWGVELAAHVVIPGVDKALLRGAIADLPVGDGRVTIGAAATSSRSGRSSSPSLRRIRGETPARILAAAAE